jgi:hypothetical protein
METLRGGVNPWNYLELVIGIKLRYREMKLICVPLSSWLETFYPRRIYFL